MVQAGETYACLVLAVAFNAALIVAYNICQVASGRHHVAERSWAVNIHGALEQLQKWHAGSRVSLTFWNVEWIA